ncbi:hypothetical protein CLAFUW4_07367 [Fulvia fulva]|uniref:Uncharacterized protein n=1 Tax=Passalora fulva TaxID=5499 RepID=A0A9Q8PB07_PASFU|nr:uncharacterized protein CLAFUR5_07497 [Fulvia fulva]KAK4621914.1 hypothetical protein CLAFUR4_07374 [Fulvia fulva]KAK4622493.1 hypothetical protein CLAFUR0_07372 [Fulvia fulva]UJO19184.1 hypothetical protein CLAFUR5_07497 [Fulvia fulva]WPV16665.1 hypothetical protein CLAFUW4_07367 [Fulvia fulva]WPV30639.1 hypothetical protein CLAFUW7_07369 [Fulvia fulva]
MSFEMSETTTEQESLAVPQGQKGYIAAYCAATLFDGTFTGCNSGPKEQPGQAMVLKSNGSTYSVVTTGA